MRDRVLGIAALVLGLAMAWGARDLVPPFTYEPVGPRAFPWLLAALLVLTGLVIAIRGGRRIEPSELTDSERAAHRILPMPVVIALVAVLFYGLTFQWLGFPIATALLVIAVAMLFGARPLQAVLAGMGFGVGLYVLFDKLLDVVLPLGLLRSVF